MLSRKLASRRGETLAETLVTILLIAMASAMLAVMLTSAVRINNTADQATKALYEELTIAETGKGGGGGSVAVTIDRGTGKQVTVTIDVTVHGAEGALRAYGKAG